MSVLGAVRDLIAASAQNPDRGTDPTVESKGAYWCHDCDERVLDLDIEGEEPPPCPSCGDEMDFERSAGSSGCAC